MLENLRTLASYASEPGFLQLASLFKRVANIARELPPGDVISHQNDELTSLTEPAEKSLYEEFTKREPVIGKPSQTGQSWLAAYESAAALGPFVARMFDEVLIMTTDEQLKLQRLLLMTKLTHAIRRLADISEIVAPES
jgi:glycyl-tRNA synthetase beta chain